MKRIISLLLWLFVPVILLLGIFHVGNSLLIHDKATVFLSGDICDVVSGELKNGICQVNADISHTVLTGNPVIRMKDGTVMEINQHELVSYAFDNSRYSIGW